MSKQKTPVKQKPQVQFNHVMAPDALPTQEQLAIGFTIAMLTGGAPPKRTMLDFAYELADDIISRRRTTR